MSGQTHKNSHYSTLSHNTYKNKKPVNVSGFVTAQHPV